MASEVNEHISSAERTKWNKTTEDLGKHEVDPKVHIPTPPSDGGNYYLGSDLKWHKVPIASVSVS